MSCLYELSLSLSLSLLLSRGTLLIADSAQRSSPLVRETEEFLSEAHGCTDRPLPFDGRRHKYDSTITLSRRRRKEERRRSPSADAREFRPRRRYLKNNQSKIKVSDLTDTEQQLRRRQKNQKPEMRRGAATRDDERRRDRLFAGRRRGRGMGEGGKK